MTINPTDYDVDELREAFGEADGPLLGEKNRDFDDAPDGPHPASSSGSEDILRSNQHRELFLLESMASAGSLEKPYLTTLPDSLAGELVVFEWLEFLLTQAGFKQTFEVLRYYRSIGWMTEDIEDRLHDYMTGLDDLARGDIAPLERSDHLLSLVYVARLATMAEE